MRKIIIFTSFLFYFFTSCNQSSPATTFEKDGVSLICPSGWKITEEEDLGDGDYYLSIEKSGLISSGIVTLFWENSELDLNQYMSTVKEELRNSPIGNNNLITFSDVYESSFNGIETISVDYTFSFMKLKYRGVIYVFYEKEKIFAIIRQEAIEDETKNAEGFKIIEERFKVE